MRPLLSKYLIKINASPFIPFIPRPLLSLHTIRLVARDVTLKNPKNYPLLTHTILELSVWLLIGGVLAVIHEGQSQSQNILARFETTLLEQVFEWFFMRILTLQLVIQLALMFCIRATEWNLYWKKLVLICLISYLPTTLFFWMITFDFEAFFPIVKVLYGFGGSFPRSDSGNYFPPIGLLIIFSNLLVYFGIRRAYSQS